MVRIIQTVLVSPILLIMVSIWLPVFLIGLLFGKVIKLKDMGW